MHMRAHKPVHKYSETEIYQIDFTPEETISGKLEHFYYKVNYRNKGIGVLFFNTNE